MVKRIATVTVMEDKVISNYVHVQVHVQEHVQVHVRMIPVLYIHRTLLRTYLIFRSTNHFFLHFENSHTPNVIRNFDLPLDDFFFLHS